MLQENDRLTQVEITVGVLKASQFNMESVITRMENAITRMADSMQRLAEAEAERKYDREIMRSVIKDVEVLDDKLEVDKQALTDYVLAQERKDANAYKAVVIKTIGVVAALIAAFIANHFGVTFIK